LGLGIQSSSALSRDQTSQRLKRIFGDISGAVDPIPIGTLSSSEREQVEKKSKEDEKKIIMVKKILKATEDK
jgi:hypothetical protein